jgi:hypothetical protein
LSTVSACRAPRSRQTWTLTKLRTTKLRTTKLRTTKLRTTKLRTTTKLRMREPDPVASAKKPTPPDDTTPETPPQEKPSGPTLHDDSALWYAVYAAAWVAEFNDARRPGDPESFSEALEMDHSYAARQIANAAVAQLRRPR